MEFLWYWIIALMIAVYVILDGFDLGAGILHLFVGRSKEDRRSIIRAIGPFWDGNEVWLLAGGGTLFLAFPHVYASSFSGFYLPLMIVLWLLMLRGLGIELRHQIHHPMWLSFWDTVFSVSSLLLTIFFGAALGNVVRGVPLDAQGYFFAPLWTTFTVVPEAGILDWFTVIMGVVALCTLAMHGAHFIAMKTEGDLRARARSFAFRAWIGTCATSIVAMAATFSIHPELWDNYGRHPAGMVLPLLAVGGLGGSLLFQRKGRDGAAFLSSSLYIGGMLASTAFGLFPRMLPASTNPIWSLTAYNSATSGYGLGVGLTWWIAGMLLATGYFSYVYRSFRGKVSGDEHGDGY